MSVGKQKILPIILSGLIAGSVLVLGEFLINGVILNVEWTILMDRLNLAHLSPAWLVVTLVLTLAVGIALMGIYVAAAAYFRSRTTAALTACVTIWFLVFAYPMAYTAGFGLIPGRLALISVIWGFGETMLAIMLGSAFYGNRRTSGNRAG